MDRRKNGGVTVFELLVAILVIGIIAGAAYQALGDTLATYSVVQTRQELLSPARFALSRIVMFVQETDQIASPAMASSGEMLAVSERLSDQYDNLTYAYVVSGDGIPDSDNNRNGIINEGGVDPAEMVTFDLDKSDATNWRLMEQFPDYSSGLTTDFKAKAVLCERVQAFSCTRLANGVVEIVLTVGQGAANVTLRTTARARLLE